jgi:MFS family permease
MAGQTVSQVGTWLQLIAQTLLVLHVTGNGFDVGLLAACQFGPILVFGAYAGLVADRSNKRRVLFVVQTVAMAQAFGLAALAFMHHPPLLALYAIALVGGTAMAFDQSVRRSFIVELVPQEYVPNAIGLNSALMTSSRVFGPALAGLTISLFGYGWCFVINGISFLATIAGLTLIRPDELRVPPVTPRGRAQVREGLHYVSTRPELWITLVMVGAVSMLAWTPTFQVVMPLMVTDAFHRGEATFTVLFSVLSLGSVLGALLVAGRHFVSVVRVAASAGLFGVVLLLFAAAPGVAVAFPLAVLVGMSSTAFMTASNAILQTRAAPDMQGRVISLAVIVTNGLAPVGGPLLGAISDSWGPRTALVVSGVTTILTCVWGAAVYRNRPREPLTELAYGGVGGAV